MRDGLDVLAARIRERREQLTATATRPPQASAYTLTLGATVFDAASGLDGTVTGVGLRDRLRVGDVRVTLDDGRSVIRGTGDLILRPAGR